MKIRHFELLIWFLFYCRISFSWVFVVSKANKARHIFKYSSMSMIDDQVSEEIRVAETTASMIPSIMSGKGQLIDVNFCLRDFDTALSGPSRSKVLNEITNDVFKAIAIGFDPIVDDLLSRFHFYREQVDLTECSLDDISQSDVTCTQDVLTSRMYIDWLEKLLDTGVTQDTILGGVYDRGYKKLLTMLKDSGCIFTDNIMKLRPKPVEANICLSMLDEKQPSRTTRTRVLNRYSNAASRVMLYGGQTERTFFANHLEDLIPSFAQQWTKGNVESQEVVYLKVLSIFVREGVRAAELAMAYKDPTTGPNGLGSQRTSGFIGSVEGLDYVAKLRLLDAYYNAFQRVVEMCLTELGKRADNVPVDKEIFNNLLNWEQGLRLNWEQGIRRDLTDGLWKRNPPELAGTWELVDVAGVGSLSNIMAPGSNNMRSSSGEGGVGSGAMVELTREGNVDFKSEAFVGSKWTFAPGPAHLDTCAFELRSQTDKDLVLKYVGFIDRGQRIESRFSRLPIRMTGRVVSVLRGEPRGSNRFIMQLPRSDLN